MKPPKLSRSTNGVAQTIVFTGRDSLLGCDILAVQDRSCNAHWPCAKLQFGKGKAGL